MQHYLQRVAEAAERPGASRLRHYFCSVRPSCLSTDGYCLPSYISQVRERRRRQALAELRTGVHWGAEERERLRGAARLPPAQRACPHCAAAGQPSSVEDTHHIVFECVLYADLRQQYPQLFPPTGSPRPRLPALSQLSLQSFLEANDAAAATSHFASACRRRARLRLGLAP